MAASNFIIFFNIALHVLIGFDICREMFPSCVRLYVQNDAVAALASGTLGKLHGCVLIAGTGTIAYGFTEDGREARAAGAGPILGDWGRYMHHFFQFQFHRAKGLKVCSTFPMYFLHAYDVCSFLGLEIRALTKFRVNGNPVRLSPIGCASLLVYNSLIL